ncbi:hypothetical protein [Peredibacter starrii]|uniref:Uncharacterized protein n=1 Tax=Peredibacter starrii TaxID=28202 RepID=A0AAX4HKX6_9BACT|nr:hypothetical protein [Peredibacter starrii]WPU63842.1 hypothetical protein SOO65_14195 [Peredibacter starrii]
MKFWALTFLLLSSQLAFSQAEEDCEEDGSSKLVAAVMKQSKAEESGNCPDKKKLMNMCMFIGSRTKDPKPVGASEYMYYRRIMEASCVDSKNDSEAETQNKIKKMWNKLENEMVCNSTIFDISNGNYIKYAVNTKFDEFIENVTEWKVNLNKVDASDGRTVLDYVKFHMEKNKGNTIEKKMKYYYDLLREAGAKHKSEL